MRTRERGSSLVVSLLFAMVVLAFATSVILSSVAVDGQRRHLVAAARAHDAAESGIHYLVAGLNGPDRLKILTEGTAFGVLQGSPDSAASLRYEVSIRPAGDDLADNDLDGLVDEEDEADMYEARSTGSIDNVTRTVRVTLLARYRTPGLAAATYIADPGADLDLAGNAFLISGRDVGLDGKETGMLVPGIGVAGDPGGIKSQIRSQQDDNVIGEGGNLSVYSVTEIDFNQLIEDAVRSANVRLDGDGGAITQTESGSWGTVEQPAIVFGSGDIHISGGASGAGAMIVDGNLTISGKFEWNGLLIVRGKVSFAGGGCEKRVVGGVVVERALTGETSLGGSGEMAIGGTVDLVFSNETLKAVSQIFASYTVINWREGPNAPEAAP